MNSTISRSIFPLALAAALAFAGAPREAEAQGRSGDREVRSGEKVEQLQRQRPELQRRTGPASVPPGWCIGRGNPHNTLENCGTSAYSQQRRGRDVIHDRSAFDRAHAAFHSEHERQCRARAAQRPLDINWQVRVRAECRAAHDRWHERYDPDWRSSE